MAAKGFAVNHSARYPEFPDVPTPTEAGIKDAGAPSRFGLCAPAGTPQPIFEPLNAKVVEIMRTDDMRKRLTALGVAGAIKNLKELEQYLAADIRHSGEVIKAANVKLD